MLLQILNDHDLLLFQVLFRKIITYYITLTEENIRPKEDMSMKKSSLFREDFNVIGSIHLLWQ